MMDMLDSGAQARKIRPVYLNGIEDNSCNVTMIAPKPTNK